MRTILKPKIVPSKSFRRSFHINYDCGFVVWDLATMQGYVQKEMFGRPNLLKKLARDQRKALCLLPDDTNDGSLHITVTNDNSPMPGFKRIGENQLKLPTGKVVYAPIADLDGFEDERMVWRIVRSKDSGMKSCIIDPGEYVVKLLMPQRETTMPSPESIAEYRKVMEKYEHGHRRLFAQYFRHRGNFMSNLKYVSAARALNREFDHLKNAFTRKHGGTNKNKLVMIFTKRRKIP
jgi:hypothetical protein